MGPFSPVPATGASESASPQTSSAAIAPDALSLAPHASSRTLGRAVPVGARGPPRRTGLRPEPLLPSGRARHRRRDPQALVPPAPAQPALLRVRLAAPLSDEGPVVAPRGDLRPRLVRVVRRRHPRGPLPVGLRRRADRAPRRLRGPPPLRAEGGTMRRSSSRARGPPHPDVALRVHGRDAHAFRPPRARLFGPPRAPGTRTRRPSCRRADRIRARDEGERGAAPPSARRRRFSRVPAGARLAQGSASPRGCRPRGPRRVLSRRAIRVPRLPRILALGVRAGRDGSPRRPHAVHEPVHRRPELSLRGPGDRLLVPRAALRPRRALGHRPAPRPLPDALSRGVGLRLVPRALRLPDVHVRGEVPALSPAHLPAPRPLGRSLANR